MLTKEATLPLPMVQLEWSIDHPDLLVGLVEAHGVRVCPTSPAPCPGPGQQEPPSPFALDELARAIDDVIVRCRQEDWPPQDLRQAIRNLLRRGGFKPTGRNKPASEYLAQAAVQGSFPWINNVVDINNLLSMETGWPMTVLDLDRISGGQPVVPLEIRFGHPDESYVFNAAGQAIKVEGLICLAHQAGPAVGNPVKDSLGAKTVDESSRLVAALYTSRTIATPAEVAQTAERYGARLKRHAGATQVWTRVLPDH